MATRRQFGSLNVLHTSAISLTDNANCVLFFYFFLFFLFFLPPSPTFFSGDTSVPFVPMPQLAAK